MEFQKGDKVKVTDSSYSYYIGEDGLEMTFCLGKMGEYEVIQTNCKMPMWYRATGKEVDSCYKDTPDNDTLIKQLSTGKIISIQERFLQKVEASKPKFQVGQKVVPVKKTPYFPLDECPNWEKAKERNQPFLYVNTVMGDNVIACHVDDKRGYQFATHYLESDLIPYVEPEVKKKYRKEINGEWVGKPQFQVGDRVRVTETYWKNGELNGKCGIICNYDGEESSAGIDFGENIGGHSCDGNCKYGNGFNIEVESLELLPPINLCPEPKTLTESKTITCEGNKTVCTIEIDGRKFTGVAKCDPKDEWDEEIGRQYAELRANRKMLDAVEKELRRG